MKDNEDDKVITKFRLEFTDKKLSDEQLRNIILNSANPKYNKKNTEEDEDTLTN